MSDDLIKLLSSNRLYSSLNIIGERKKTFLFECYKILSV